MDIEYHLIRSDRRSIGIEVDREGKVTVRAPYSCEKKRIDRFLLEKENWIRQKVKLQKENAMKRQEKREMPEAEKKYYRNLAREVLGARTGYYARKMGVTYGRISIREQKTRWGSCSSKGNLNFNCLLMLTLPEVIDYVVNTINSDPVMEVEYYEIVDGNTLESIKNWSDTDYPVGCITVYCGEVRLIDNIKY